MPKVVILGSCRFEPYDVICVPKKVKGKWNTDEGYKISTKRFYPAIHQCDEVWIYAPDGIGKHTQMDLNYALKIGKPIRYLKIKLSLKEKVLNIIEKLLRRHIHSFYYFYLRNERFAYMSDHETYHSRICRCGLKQKKEFASNQEGEICESRWVV